MRKALVSHASAPSLQRRIARGFTLIEVMIVVVIIAILAAVAIPSYRDYILRGQLVDATTLLSTFRGNMERYYQDNRQYTTISTNIVAPCAVTDVTQRTQGKFVVTCSSLTANSFTLMATGSGPTQNFIYTVTETGAQATTSVGAPGWSTSTTCWVVKKGQVC